MLHPQHTAVYSLHLLHFLHLLPVWHPLQHVHINPCLGIQLSNDLKWSIHIAALAFLEEICVFALSSPVQEECLPVRLSLTRPALEYTSIIWSPYLTQHVEKLAQVQHLSAWLITGDYKSRAPGSIIDILYKYSPNSKFQPCPKSRQVTKCGPRRTFVLPAEALCRLKKATNLRIIFILTNVHL